MSLPQFFIVGAPKAGTTALHAALASHPRLFLSPVKEPKFFLCDGRAPRPQHGPGDGHSAREWIWRRDQYESLFDAARPGQLRGESTPFYLYDHNAPRRIRALVPDARLVVVVRDPVDRAYSNWMHLWSDGLEPEADFVQAVRAEPQRIAKGWGPFWHYRGLGRYGEQLASLLESFDRAQVHILRYRDLVDHPATTLDTVCRFLGVEPGRATTAPAENVRPFVPPSASRQLLATAIRAGAAAGAHAPPWAWRRASRPLLSLLHAAGGARPRLTPAQRREVLDPLADDVRLLSALTGQSFDDWLGDHGRGDFRSRLAAGGDEAG
ncbi:MAG: sulfotransferase family protein [Dermatophilaceae bacterium]